MFATNTPGAGCVLRPRALLRRARRGERSLRGRLAARAWVPRAATRVRRHGGFAIRFLSALPKTASG